MSQFNWTEKSLRAIDLLAEGRLSWDKIAEKTGTHRNTLKAWKKHPTFAARLEETIAEIRLRMTERAIARKEHRINTYNDLMFRVMDVFDARAADTSMAMIPGGDTGLLVRRFKMIGSGENATEVQEYDIDTPSVKALLDTMKQAAIEVGEWDVKSPPVSGKVYQDAIDRIREKRRMKALNGGTGK